MSRDDKLHDAMAYLCTHYPFPDELSKARLTKLLYLSDWRMALTHRRQVTAISWIYNHYGPYVRDVERLAESSPDFTITSEVNAYGSFKERISALPSARWDGLSGEEKEALDFAMSQTQHLNFTEFLNLIYSTYPVRTSQKYARLDLVASAKEYVAQ